MSWVDMEDWRTTASNLHVSRTEPYMQAGGQAAMTLDWYGMMSIGRRPRCLVYLLLLLATHVVAGSCTCGLLAT